MNPTVFLSAAFGLFFGLGTYFILLFILPQEALTLAVAAGSGSGLLLYAYLVLHTRRMSSVYADFEKTLPSEIICRSNGNFRVDEGRVRNGNLYLCADLLVCASLDEKPHIIERIPRDCVEKIWVDRGTLNISARSGKTLSFILPDLQAFQEKLREKEWI